MLLRDSGLVACLGHVDRGLVELLARQRALFEQLLAALVDLLLGIERFLRLLRVSLGLLNFFGKAGRCGRLVRGLGLIQCTLRILCGRAEVPIFEHCQQLALMHAAAALHQELCDRSADLGHNGRLLAGKQNRFRADRVFDRGFFHRRDLNRNFRFCIALIAGATGEKQQRKHGRVDGQLARGAGQGTGMTLKSDGEFGVVHSG